MPIPNTKTAVPEKNRWKSIDKKLSYFNGIALRIGLWVLIIVGLGLLWKAYNQDSFFLDPIEVPDELRAQGFSSKVVVKRLSEQLFDLQNNVKSVRDFQGFSSDAKSTAVDFQVAGFGLSVQSLAMQLRKAMGKTEQTIDGDIVFSKDSLHLNLRLRGASIGKVSLAKTAALNQDIDKLLSKASIIIFKETEPYLYLVYLSDHASYEEAEQAIRNYLTSTEEKEWAYNLLGNLENKNGNISRSIKYHKAAAAYNPQFALTINNLAKRYGELDSLDLKIQYLEKYLSLEKKQEVYWEKMNLLLSYELKGNNRDRVLELRKDLMENASLAPLSITMTNLFNKGEYQKALEFSKVIRRKYPDNFEAIFFQGLINCSNASNAECQALQLEIETRYPDYPEVLILKMISLAKMGDSKAVTEVKDSIKTYVTIQVLFFKKSDKY